MNALQEETVSVLRGLASICRDGQQGFREAADQLGNEPELKSLLSSFSQQRAKFAGELENQAISLGAPEVVEERGTASGTAHRAWMNLKAAVTRGDTRSILAECERAEDTAVEEYQKALAHDLPDSVRGVIQRQRDEVQATHGTVRTLRDRYATGAQRAGESIRSAAGSVAGSASAAAGRVSSSASDVWNETKTRAGEFQKSARGFARRSPLPSLGMALAAGFITGLLVYAMELRNERVVMERRRIGLWGTRTRLANWLAGRRAGGEFKRPIGMLRRWREESGGFFNR